MAIILSCLSFNSDEFLLDFFIDPYDVIRQAGVLLPGSEIYPAQQIHTSAWCDRSMRPL